MTRHDQFYLTLPSNSSMSYYPDNKVANYTTHLPTTIELTDGEWEVALVEMHYTCSFLTVGPDVRLTLHIKLSTVRPNILADKYVVEVSPRNLTDVRDLIATINANENMQFFEVSLVYNADTGLVDVQDKGGSRSPVTRLEMSTELALLLGFDPTAEDALHYDKPKRPANINATLPSHMYVYCDLIEPQLVGDTLAPLLKIVNVDATKYKYGSHATVHINDPHYVPVLKTSFENVEIDLRSDTGAHLPFDFGTSCAKLHLRKARGQ